MAHVLEKTVKVPFIYRAQFRKFLHKSEELARHMRVPFYVKEYGFFSPKFVVHASPEVMTVFNNLLSRL